MIRRSFVVGSAALSLALSGCGGGGSTPTPTPTPTPTSTATPTPTPASYATFPLTANSEFATVTGFTSFTGDLTAGPVTLGASGTETGTTRFRVAVLADPTTASSTTPQVVHENTEETRFVAADLTAGTPPATSVNEFVFKFTGSTAGQYSTAEFLNNTVSGKVTTDAALALTRVSYTGWVRADSTTGQTRITYGAWGYPTVSSDMPTTGSATYTAKIAGRAVGVVGAGTGTMSRLGGTVTVTVNFASGLVTVTANVTTVDSGGVETPYGTYTGNGAFGSGSTQFTGSFGPSSPIPGTFAGAFFGSQGEQIAVTFAGSGTISAVDTRIAGVLVGKKD